MFKTKRREVVSLQIFERKCIACERCIERCRHKALGMVYKENLSYAVVEHKNRCVGCGGCEYVCPTDAIELITAN